MGVWRIFKTVVGGGGRPQFSEGAPSLLTHGVLPPPLPHVHGMTPSCNCKMSPSSGFNLVRRFSLEAQSERFNEIDDFGEYNFFFNTFPSTS